MNSIIEKITGMDKMSDQVIATDFFISSKSLVLAYSIAITETISPKVKTELRKQLNNAIATQEAILNYMINKDYYKAYDLKKQLNKDINITKDTLSLTSE